MSETRPEYYGGAGATYECINVIEANGWLEGMCKGTALKYLTRGGKKKTEAEIKDMKKACEYIGFWIRHLEYYVEIAELAMQPEEDQYTTTSGPMDLTLFGDLGDADGPATRS